MEALLTLFIMAAVIVVVLLRVQALLIERRLRHGHRQDSARRGHPGTGAGAANPALTPVDAVAAVARAYAATLGAGARASGAGESASPGEGEGEGPDANPRDTTVAEDSSPRIGWKSVRLEVVGGVPRLVSRYNDAVWKGFPPRLVACCSPASSGHPGASLPTHAAPDPDCMCGIYSLEERAGVSRNGESSSVLIRIRHFGRTIVGQMGTRSAVAVVEAVVVPRCHACWRRADVVQWVAAYQQCGPPLFSCGWHYQPVANAPVAYTAPQFVVPFLLGLGVAEVIRDPEPAVALCYVCRELRPATDSACFNCAGAYGKPNGGYQPTTESVRVHRAPAPAAQEDPAHPYFAWRGM